MRKEVVIKKSLTNRLKRELKKIDHHHGSYLVTEALSHTLARLNIIDDKQGYDLHKLACMYERKWKNQRDKALCIRFSPPPSLWIEKPAIEYEKEKQKRMRKLEAKMRYVNSLIVSAQNE